ncbi:MAG TPA: hypothetical protein VH476_05330 [Solirubrobacterales bacterium]|jgi:hypothetical protein
MRKRIKLGRPGHSAVVAYLALFLALGGSAYAFHLGKNSVGPKQLKKNSVTGPKIKSNAVSGAKIAGNAVDGSKVKDGSLTGSDIQPGSLTGANINQSSLTGVRAGNVTSMAFTGDNSCSPALPLPSGVTSSRTSDGVCLITFPNSISGCTANATIHFRPTKIMLLTVSDRSAQVFTNPNKPNLMSVETYEENALTNLPFDLVLVC